MLQGKNAGLLGLLLILMILTRSHQFSVFSHLGDASWALFFIAGFYLAGQWSLWLLLGAAFAIDYDAISYGGVGDYCISAGYFALIPAYASLWWGGRWYAGRHRLAWSSLPLLAAVYSTAVVACFVISNLGFYAFAGQVAEQGLWQYAQAVAPYLPGYWLSASLYLGFAVALHLMLVAWRGEPAALSRS